MYSNTVRWTGVTLASFFARALLCPPRRLQTLWTGCTVIRQHWASPPHSLLVLRHCIDALEGHLIHIRVLCQMPARTNYPAGPDPGFQGGSNYDLGCTNFRFQPRVIDRLCVFEWVFKQLLITLATYNVHFWVLRRKLHRYRW